MSKLLMLIGLPGSGKSTIAKALETSTTEKWIRVNKDDIRARFAETGWTWSREREQDVIKERDDRVAQYLREGYSVVSDDTNFGRKHKTRLAELARRYGAEFEIQRVDVPVQDCLAQNAKREGTAKVPEKVVMDMFNNYVSNDPEHFPISAPARIYASDKVEYIEGLPSAVICDLDGTLADFSKNRGPYDATDCENDAVIKPIYRLIHLIRAYRGPKIIYLSGREAKFREGTEKFLHKHACPDGDLLFMRPTGDFRKDWIVKRELFDANVKGKWNVEFVLDDRDQVVKMWRALGLTCLQVADGNF